MKAGWNSTTRGGFFFVYTSGLIIYFNNNCASLQSHLMTKDCFLLLDILCSKIKLCFMLHEIFVNRLFQSHSVFIVWFYRLRLVFNPTPAYHKAEDTQIDIWTPRQKLHKLRSFVNWIIVLINCVCFDFFVLWKQIVRIYYRSIFPYFDIVKSWWSSDNTTSPVENCSYSLKEFKDQMRNWKIRCGEK